MPDYLRNEVFKIACFFFQITRKCTHVAYICLAKQKKESWTTIHKWVVDKTCVNHKKRALVNPEMHAIHIKDRQKDCQICFVLYMCILFYCVLIKVWIER